MSVNLEKALKIIENRKRNAEKVLAEHNSEVVKKIPRVDFLYKELSLTGYKLFNAIFNKKSTIEAIKNENLLIQKEITNLLIENGYDKNYLKPKYFCSICKDSGYVNGYKCKCLKKLIIELNENDLNKITMDKTFENFSLGYYDRNSLNTMSSIFEFCKLYAEGFSLNSHSVLMIGNTGLGKTHLSSAIAKKVSQNGFSVMYVSYLDLVRNLQSEYFGKSDGNTMSKVLDADLLILDDLGVEFDSQFNISALYNIINSRTNKPTIINTNLTAAELEKKYSQRIVSRLLTLYKCLKFTGVDVRYLKLKNHEI